MFNFFPKVTPRVGAGLVALVTLSACLDVDIPSQTPAPRTPAPQTPPPQVQPVQTRPSASGPVTVESFAAIVRQVEPIAESECRARTSGANCDFKIVVNRNPKAPSNAYQSVDVTGARR